MVVMSKDKVRRLGKVLLYAAPFVFGLYLFWGVYVYFSTGSDDEIIENHQVVKDAFVAFERKIEKYSGGLPVTEDLKVDANAFVYFSVSFTAELKDNKIEYDASYYRAELKIGNIVVSVFAFGILWVLLLVLYSDGTGKEIGKEYAIDSLEDIFARDLNEAYREVLKMRKSSLGLLIVGLGTSVLGILVFYITVPSYDIFREGLDKSYIILSILRPLCMLFFIESISWFLLRQYRNSMEDYKQFYRIYLRRKNFKISYFLITANKEEFKDLIKAILLDDQSGKLTEGETTEYLENKKIKEDPEILENIQMVGKSLA